MERGPEQPLPAEREKALLRRLFRLTDPFQKRTTETDEELRLIQKDLIENGNFKDEEQIRQRVSDMAVMWYFDEENNERDAKKKYQK